MKQMFTLALALTTFTALFAQRNNGYHDDHIANSYSNQPYNVDEVNGRPDRAIAWQENRGRCGDAGGLNNDDQRARTDDNYRQDERRRDDYGVSRNNRWQRSDGKDELRKERTGKLAAFGGGVLAGGVLAVLLSAHR